MTVTSPADIISLMKPEVRYAVPAVFPREYTKFNPGEIRDNVARLQGRSNLRTYDLAWLGLMEEIDRINQRRAIVKTRQTLRDIPFTANRAFHQETVENYWADLENTSCYPHYLKIKEDFDRIDPDVENLDDIEVFPWVLDAIESAGGNQDHIQYAIMLQKRLGARIAATTPILDLYQKVITKKDNPYGRNFVDRMKEPDIFEREVKKTLVKTEPYHKLDPVLNTNISQMEERLFGEDKDQAVRLWKGAVFLRTSELPDNVSGSKIRVPLIKLLVQKEYRQAALYLEEVLAKYPRLLPNFAIDELNIDPTGLRSIMDSVAMEAKAKTKADADASRREDIELSRLMQKERWERMRTATDEKYRQRRADRMEEIRVKEESKGGILGKEFVSPDGQIRICVIKKSFGIYSFTFEGIKASGVASASRIFELIDTHQLQPVEELERIEVNIAAIPKLRTLREERGLSQGEIARLTDLRQTDVSKAEIGEYYEFRIRWFGIVRMAQALGVSPFDIATEAGKERLTELMEKYPQMIS